MSGIKTVAAGFARYIADELHCDMQRQDTIRFGLEILIGSCVKGVIIVLISYALGILPYALAVLGTSITLRLTSGGTHLRTYSRCMTFSTLMTIAISYLAIHTTPFFNNAAMPLLICGAAITGFLYIKEWAPADSPGKPIRRKEKIEIYRSLSELYVLVWATVLVFIYLIPWETTLPVTLSLASIGGFIWQVLSITPESYRLAGSADQWLDRVLVSRR